MLDVHYAPYLTYDSYKHPHIPFLSICTSALSGYTCFMRRYDILLITLLLMLTACQTSSNKSSSTALPFPTVTPGRVLQGILATPQNSGALSNPATAIAFVNQPTPTPDTRACPPASEHAELSEVPSNGDEIATEIVRFLSAGGTAIALEEALKDDWVVLGEDGFVRSDIDLTGDNTPEVIMGYTVPGEGSILLITGCEEGHFVLRHETVTETSIPPQIILIGDVNQSRLPNLTFVTQICENDDECRYQTHIIEWQPDLGRFVSLLGTTILSDELPEQADMDNDAVIEVIIRMESNGTLATGPLRTGVNIYDWNGSSYVLSISRPDAPRFRIQIVHEADRYFARHEMTDAINLYQMALTDDDLRVWLDNEGTFLESYILYRILLAYAFDDSPDAEVVYQHILGEFINQAGEGHTSVYIDMSRTFWDTFQVVNNMNTACQAVLAIVEDQPQALDLINGYGNRNPTYNAYDLCPF